jgi:hypothetical protein
MFMHPGGLLVQLKQLETMPIEYPGAKAKLTQAPCQEVSLF